MKKRPSIDPYSSLKCTLSTSKGEGKCCLFTCPAGTKDRHKHSSTTNRLRLYKGVIGQTHAPAALPPGRRPDIHCTEGWVVLGPVWTSSENVANEAVRDPDHPSQSESLYLHPGPNINQ
jgi:hypothetical protein